MRSLGLAVLLFAAAAAPCQQREFDDLGRRALAAARDGNFTDAIASYRRMLALDAANASVRYDLALLLYRLGRARESLDTLRVPQGADALALAGANQRVLGRPDKALPFLRKAYAFKPDIDIAYDFGMVLLDLDKHVEAERLFCRFPGEARALIGRGLAAFATGRPEEAGRWFRQAAAKEPGAADVHALIGDVAFTSSQFDEAAEAYAEALRLEPNNSENQVKAGRNLLRLERAGEARERFTRAASINPLDAEAHFELGRLALESGDAQAARRHLEASAGAAPLRPATAYQLARLYRSLGEGKRASEALASFERLKEETPGLRVEIDPPSLMVEGPPEETRWGRYQFPAVHRMADGRLISFVHVEADSAAAYGLPKRTFVSSDDGFTWREEAEAASQPYGLRLGPAEWLRIDTPPSLDASKLSLPAPAGSFTSYRQAYSLYRMTELPADLRAIFFQRHVNGGWKSESTVLDEPAGLRYVTGGRFPRIWWGDMRKAADGSLLAVTYPSIAGGGPPFHFTSACWRSVDGGRAWRMLARIPYRPDEAADPQAAKRDGFSEPTFEVLSDGALYAVLRTTDGNGSGPMYSVRSSDNGRTWTKPAVMAPAGVLPRLLRLANGVLVLSSGRPGVQLRFSRDGHGRTWSKPWELVPITNDGIQYDTCGYTDLAAIDRDSFLIVYSWFRKPDQAGRPRKAILARRVRVFLPAGPKQ